MSSSPSMGEGIFERLWNRVLSSCGFLEEHPRASLTALVVAVAVFPFLSVGSDYVLHIMIYMMLYMILALGLNIVPGFTGLLDLGYVGFYGIGAYTAGLLSVRFVGEPGLLGLLGSYWIIIPLAALNGALWGVLRAAPTLRLSGDYFAIVTFGFSELVVLVLTNETWLTRGPMGIPGIAPPTIGPIILLDKRWMYLLVLAMLSATVFIMRRLEDSRLGRAWFAIREDEVAAESCGIDLVRYKVKAFAISASFGAVAGSFTAKYITFISPNMFKFWESILVLCMIVFGGMGSIPGAIVGAGILVALSEILRVVLPTSLVGARYLLFGALLIIMMRVKPQGLLPAGRKRPEPHPYGVELLGRDGAGVGAAGEEM